MPPTDAASRPEESNPRLPDSEALCLVRDPRAPAAALLRLARDPRWTGRQAVLRGVVLHRNTPPHAARNLVAHLHWRELAEVAGEPHVHPVVRRLAERLLAQRLEELALGERVALARRAPRGLVGALLSSSDAALLAALLDNPRLVEADVLRIARGRRTPPDLLGRLARHHRWGCRRAVRLELLRNPRAPIADALRLAHALDRRDLRGLIDDDAVAAVVRIAAARRLAGARAPRAAPAEHAGRAARAVDRGRSR